MTDSATTIEITYHARKRWAQRVWQVGLSDDDVKKYTQQHWDALGNEVQAAYEEAECLWTGKIAPKFAEAHFYMWQDVALVVASDTPTLVTVYKSDLGMPDPVQRKMVKEAKSQIKRLTLKREKYTQKHGKFIRDKRQRRKDIQERREKLKADHAAHLEILEQQDEKARKQLLEKRSALDDYDAQIEEYAKILFNRLELKNELERGHVTL